MAKEDQSMSSFRRSAEEVKEVIADLKDVLSKLSPDATIEATGTLTFRELGLTLGYFSSRGCNGCTGCGGCYGCTGCSHTLKVAEAMVQPRTSVETMPPQTSPDR